MMQMDTNIQAILKMFFLLDDQIQVADEVGDYHCLHTRLLAWSSESHVYLHHAWEDLQRAAKSTESVQNQSPLLKKDPISREKCCDLWRHSFYEIKRVFQSPYLERLKHLLDRRRCISDDTTECRLWSIKETSLLETRTVPPSYSCRFSVSF